MLSFHNLATLWAKKEWALFPMQDIDILVYALVYRLVTYPNVLCNCDSGEGRKRSQMSIPASSIYTLGGKDVDLTNMVGVLKTPAGATEPCLLKKMSDGKLGICLYRPWMTVL